MNEYSAGREWNFCEAKEAQKKGQKNDETKKKKKTKRKELIRFAF